MCKIKDIPNHKGYKINEYGVVVYDKDKCMKRISWNSVTAKDNVFLYTNIKDDNGKRHRVYMHKLVAEVFVSNPYGYHDVKHIDGNTMNNSIDNLVWYDSVADFMEKHKGLKTICNLPNYLISNDGKLYTSTSQKRLRRSGIPFEFLVKSVKIRDYKNSPYVKVNVWNGTTYTREKMFISDFIVGEVVSDGVLIPHSLDYYITKTGDVYTKKKLRKVTNEDAYRVIDEANVITPTPINGEVYVEVIYITDTESGGYVKKRVRLAVLLLNAFGSIKRSKYDDVHYKDNNGFNVTLDNISYKCDNRFKHIGEAKHIPNAPNYMFTKRWHCFQKSIHYINNK